jgi:hypothetical protein
LARGPFGAVASGSNAYFGRGPIRADRGGFCVVLRGCLSLTGFGVGIACLLLNLVREKAAPVNWRSSPAPLHGADDGC